MAIRTLIYSIVALFCLHFSAQVAAAPAQALGYKPKYSPGFDHFDYVNPTAPRGGGLTLPALGNFDSLNPFVLKGVAASGVSSLMFDTLMEASLDEPFSQYGLLAEDAELAADGLSVTYRLNPAARFADGSPVLAEDVKFSFDTLMGEQAHPQYRFYYGDVKRAVVVDERTVRFEFAKVNPELHMIVGGQLPIFSRAWLAGKRLDQLILEPPVASGPYRIAHYDLGRSIVFERRPEYWANHLNTRRGMFNFDRIEFKYYRDGTAMLEAFKAGEYDFSYVLSSKQWARDYLGEKFDSGAIRKAEFAHENNAGMQGFVMNSRREVFRDKRVRRAIILAMDFRWTNHHLFYDQYARCDSYYSNSEMAATGIPQGDELALLAPYRDQLPAQLFTEPYWVPDTEPPHSLRDNLRQALGLLQEAGWSYRDGAMRNAAGEPLTFQVMLVQKEFERVFAPFARNLAKLGIEVSYRTVDRSLFQRRLDTFDFDMIVDSFAASQSPGNELYMSFHSKSAQQEGSQNTAGISDPVVDAMIDKVVFAPNRKALVTAARALDRVLLWGEYLVPNWYVPFHRVAYWDRFGIPSTLPKYYGAQTWAVRTWWRRP